MNATNETKNKEELALTDTNDYQNYSMKPTWSELMRRTFPLWQMVRFIWINILMVLMISKSHERKNEHAD